MSGLLLNLILIVALLAPFAVRRNQPPLANDDQRVLLFQPAAIVEIPVLDNDVDADGNALHVVELSTVEGGRAELVEGALVRVYPDWSRVEASSNTAWRMEHIWSATAQRCAGRVGLSGTGRSCSHKLLPG